MRSQPAPMHSAVVLAALFALIFTLVGWDLASDYREGVTALHVMIESLVLVISGGAMLVLLIQVLGHRRRMHAIVARLSETRTESRHWREKYRETVRGLSRAIRSQFEAWGLSPAESEVGLLLLKGLSLKEIAVVRTTSDRTVRDQARAIYRKAGLPNRSALSAFFLEDLLPPAEQDPENGPEDQPRT